MSVKPIWSHTWREEKKWNTGDPTEYIPCLVDESPTKWVHWMPTTTDSRSSSRNQHSNSWGLGEEDRVRCLLNPKECSRYQGFLSYTFDGKIYQTQILYRLTVKTTFDDQLVSKFFWTFEQSNRLFWTIHFYSLKNVYRNFKELRGGKLPRNSLKLVCVAYTMKCLSFIYITLWTSTPL